MNPANFKNFRMAKADQVICHCKQITSNEIENAIRMGAKTLIDIQNSTGACTGNQCKELNPSGKCCSGDIVRILKTFRVEKIN